MNKKTYERLSFIDTARGLAIIMVIIGHYLEEGRLVQFIYSYHMPLFFFITGLTFVEDSIHENIWSFTERRIKRIYIPYVLAVFAFGKYSIKNSIWMLYGSRDAIGFSDSYGPLWFLPCLLMATVSFFIALKIYICVGAYLFTGFMHSWDRNDRICYGRD